jgi:hypothetical protein
MKAPGLRVIHGTVVFVAAIVFGACQSTPSAPSSRLPAPALVAPPDDAIADQPPLLTITNVTSTTSATRTYDFQVAETEAALSGSAAGLLASASGVAEGTGGQTSYRLDVRLSPSKRYFWRARAVDGADAGTWTRAFRFQTEAVRNTPPTIEWLFTNTERAEVNGQIELTAVVSDAETDAASLLYEWTATGGTFTGSGRSVVWRAPGSANPAVHDLKLTVIDRYTATDADGKSQPRENRVSRSATAHMNDSPAELSALALTFLDDFVHSERSPEFCVRNFSDACRGKAEELSDIQRNRALYIVDPSRSSFRIHSIAYNTAGNVPTQATFATVLAPCEFASTEKATGMFGIARGTCRLTNVYEDFRWRLCESNFLPPLNSVFDVFSKRFVF